MLISSFAELCIRHQTLGRTGPESLCIYRLAQPKPQCLADIVEIVSRRLSDQVVLVSVRRGSVLEYAIKCAKRSVFSPTKMLKACCFTYILTSNCICPS